MTRYYYRGAVIVRWCPSEWKERRLVYHDVEFLVDADSKSDAFAKVQDKVLETLIHDKEVGPWMVLPVLEFPGTMTEAINDFEIKEAEFDE